MKRMKTIGILLLLILLSLCIAVACSEKQDGEDETTDAATDETTETKGLPAADGTLITDDKLYGWFEYGGNLTLRDRYEAVGTRDSMSISMAKNEMEGFQYVLLSNKSYDDLRLEVSALTDGKGNTLEGTVFVAYNVYVNMADDTHPRGYTPEILMPQDDDYQGGTFDLVAMRAKTLYVQYKTDINTVPGIYTGCLEIKQGDTVLLSGQVSVKVWDIYYDEKTESTSSVGYQYCKNDWGAGGPGPEGAPDMDPSNAENAWEVRRQYYDFLLEHRLVANALPLENDFLHEDFEAVERYMNDPRVATIFGLQNNELLEAQLAVVKANGWLDRVCVFMGDEPTSMGMIDYYKGKADDIHSRTGLTRFPAAFGIVNKTMLPDEGTNVLDRMAEYSTYHIVNAIYVTPGPLLNSIRRLQAEGHTIEWYVCSSQEYDRINLLTCTPGTDKRILFWQQYQNDIDGFSYFHTTRWNAYYDPWAEDYEEHKWKLPRPDLDSPTGDGVMMYWHPVTKAPVGTLTLEACRDGIEDFQLLRMAEYTLGKEVAMAYAERITTANNVYTKDPVLLAQVRQELGDALEAALGKNNEIIK